MMRWMSTCPVRTLGTHCPLLKLLPGGQLTRASSQTQPSPVERLPAGHLASQALCAPVFEAPPQAETRATNESMPKREITSRILHAIRRFDAQKLEASRKHAGG